MRQQYIIRIMSVISMIMGSLAWMPVYAGNEPKTPPVLDLPGDPDELREACRHDPLLQRWSKGGIAPGRPLCEGYQSMLLDDDQLPVVDRPHIPWAKPLPAGPIRIAYFVMANGRNMCDMAEVARRMDCQLYTVEISPNYEIPLPKEAVYYGPATDPITGWLARKALKTLDRDLDVIILASECFRLPADVIARIIDKVKSGTGLMIVDGNVFIDDYKPLYDNTVFKGCLKEYSPFKGNRQAKAIQDHADIAYLMPEVASDVPFQAFPSITYLNAPLKDGFRPIATENDIPLWIAGEIGKGRLIVYNTRGNLFPIPLAEGIGRNQASHRYQEYMASMAAKLIRWTARREPSVRISLSAPASVEAGKPFPLTVKTIGKSDDGALNLEVTFRNFEFRPLFEKKIAVKLPATGEVTTQLDMPSVPAGARFVAGVIARNKKGESIDWGQLVVESRTPESLTVKTDKEIYQEKETVNFSAEMTGAEAGKKYDATVKIFDATGRLLKEETTVFADGKISGAFPIGKVISPAFELEVTVRRDNQEVLVKSAIFYSPQFGWTDYRNGIWADWRDSPYFYEEGHRILRDYAELDCLSAHWGEEPLIAAKLGIRNYRSNDGAFTPAGLYIDPDKESDKSAKTLEKAISWSARYGTTTWIIQDERNASSVFNDASFSPKVQGLFREWLKKRYNNDIGQINSAWNKTFVAFDEILPFLEKDLPTTPASMVGWMDTRMFVRDQSLAIDSRNAGSVRDVLPGPQYIGMDAFVLTSHHIPYSGCDFGLLLTGPFNTHFPYVSARLGETQMLRALAPHDSPFQTYGPGKYTPKWTYFAQPWQTVMAGGGGGVLGLSRFYSRTFVHQYGALYKQTSWFTEAERPLRQGLGKVLLDSKHQYDPVAIMFSQPSLMVNYAAGKWVDPENKTLLVRPGVASLNSIQAMLQDNGILPDWVTDDQVAKGNFKNAKLLIIPDVMGMALSDAACEAIRQFVKNGGTVLAMVSPALYDDRGKLRGKGGLDDVFGVTRDTMQLASRPADYLVNGSKVYDPRLPIAGWFIAEYYEKGLKVTTGKALGEHIMVKEPVPAFVVNDFGKGKALLLNMLETQYVRTPYQAAQKMMQAVLSFADITPPVVVTDALNSYRWGYQVNRHTDGDNMYVGVYRLSDNPSFYDEDSVVKLPKKGHVYLAGGILNAQKGLLQTPAYLGETDAPKVVLKGAGSVLLAVLPYTVDDMSVDFPAKIKAGTAITGSVSLKTSGKPGRHVVNVEVRDPDGMRHAVYCYNAVLLDGKGEALVPFALNDTKGKWTVRVKEALTGKEVTKSITVE